MRRSIFAMLAVVLFGALAFGSLYEVGWSKRVMAGETVDQLDFGFHPRWTVSAFAWDGSFTTMVSWQTIPTGGMTLGIGGHFGFEPAEQGIISLGDSYGVDCSVGLLADAGWIYVGTELLARLELSTEKPTVEFIPSLYVGTNSAGVALVAWTLLWAFGSAL